MQDKSLLEHIHALVEEEKQLRAAHRGLSADDRARLQAVEHDLDRTWDLLRRRRAQEEYGEDPDTVAERSTDEVESYLQ